MEWISYTDDGLSSMENKKSLRDTGVSKVVVRSLSDLSTTIMHAL